jgi:hypothetical protein
MTVLPSAKRVGIRIGHRSGAGRYLLSGAKRKTSARIELFRFYATKTHSRTRGRVACSLGRLTSAASRRSVCDRRQGELKAGAARQAANRIAPRHKSKGLRDISNPSKRRSIDIRRTMRSVAPSFWEYPSRTVTHRSERMCHSQTLDVWPHLRFGRP